MVWARGRLLSCGCFFEVFFHWLSAFLGEAVQPINFNVTGAFPERFVLCARLRMRARGVLGEAETPRER